MKHTNESMIVVFDFEKKPESWEVWHCEWIADEGWFKMSVCDNSVVLGDGMFTVFMIQKHEARFMYE